MSTDNIEEPIRNVPRSEVNIFHEKNLIIYIGLFPASLLWLTNADGQSFIGYHLINVPKTLTPSGEQTEAIISHDASVVMP